MEDTFIVKTVEKDEGAWYVTSVARNGRIMSRTSQKNRAARLTAEQVNSISQWREKRRQKDEYVPKYTVSIDSED